MVKRLGFLLHVPKFKQDQTSQSIYFYQKSSAEMELSKENRMKIGWKITILCPFNMSETGSKVMPCAYFLEHVHFPSNILSLKQSARVIFFFCMIKAVKLHNLLRRLWRIKLSNVLYAVLFLFYALL